jgi:hypothetical protein
MNARKYSALLSFPVIVAALGYFVDIYDLLLFGIVREPSLLALGFSKIEVDTIGNLILNWQMAGLLLGGILWGVLGDKKGRLTVLFGSIILYSMANIACGFLPYFPNDKSFITDSYILLRFIAGVGGEQFALADTVDALRRRHKLWQQELERPAAQRSPVRTIINATDPLNLLGSVLPEKRVPHLGGNRILFEDGVPVAVLEKDTARCLQAVHEDKQWEYQQLLQRRHYPPRLRAYLGKL